MYFYFFPRSYNEEHQRKNILKYKNRVQSSRLISKFINLVLILTPYIEFGINSIYFQLVLNFSQVYIISKIFYVIVLHNCSFLEIVLSTF